MKNIVDTITNDSTRAVVEDLIDRTKIKVNNDLKKYRVVTKIEWNDSVPGFSSLVISYKFYTLTYIENGTEPLTYRYRD